MNPFTILTTTLLLTACTLTEVSTAACDGLHVRPANPIGSVLNSSTENNPRATHQGASQPEAQAGMARESFGSCQRQRS